MKHEFDVVIVGGGVAGCMAATTLGRRAKGFRILLVDRNPRTEVGKKTTLGWICGDAVGERHMKFVQEKLGITFDSPEVENRVKELVVCSPDMSTSYPFEGSGYVLDRPKFARRLLAEALKTGIEYRESTRVTDLVSDGNFVTGIVCQGESDNQSKSYMITSRLVIDASGMATRLRRSLTIPSYIEKEIDKNDVEPTIRLNARLASGNSVDTSRCEIYMNAEKAPGGYLWMFPKSINKVNIGLGVQQRRTNTSLEGLLKRWIVETPLFTNMVPLSDDGNQPGAWPVSVRHQNDSLVANGFMLAGDSGWFPNPISAGGIGPALTGAVIAGEVAANALEMGEASESNLWDYNVRYVEKYGNKTAALETFRSYLQTLDNSELNYGLRNFVTRREAADFTYGGVPELGFIEKIQKAALGLRKLHAFRGLAFSVSRMRALNQLYNEYPKTPHRFPEWKKRVDTILEEVRDRFR